MRYHGPSIGQVESTAGRWTCLRTIFQFVILTQDIRAHSGSQPVNETWLKWPAEGAFAAKTAMLFRINHSMATISRPIAELDLGKQSVSVGPDERRSASELRRRLGINSKPRARLLSRVKRDPWPMRSSRGIGKLKSRVSRVIREMSVNQNIAPDSLSYQRVCWQEASHTRGLTSENRCLNRQLAGCEGKWSCAPVAPVAPVLCLLFPPFIPHTDG